MKNESPHPEAVRHTATIEDEVSRLLATVNHPCRASWMKEQMSMIVNQDAVKRIGNGIAGMIFNLAERAYVTTQEDYSHSPGYVGFCIIEGLDKDSQRAILHGFCKADRYGHISQDARAYASQHGISLAA
jgi:hypothetical protein